MRGFGGGSLLLPQPPGFDKIIVKGMEITSVGFTELKTEKREEALTK